MSRGEAAQPNADMIAFWNEDAGPRWVRFQEILDELMEGIGRRVLEASGASSGESVMDVGCGCGTSTLELARRVGTEGRVVGVDVSEVMLARARARARAEVDQLGNVAFLRADVQEHPFPQAVHDLVFSRFGVMFFDDAVRAFTNLRKALVPEGRLVFCSWRSREENPWMFTALEAVRGLVELPEPPPPGAPGPFALADARRLERLLEEAGFARVVARDVDETVVHGGAAGLDGAVSFAVEFGPLSRVLADASEEVRRQARDAVRAAYEPRLIDGGVRFPAAARIVTARPA